MRRLEVEVVFSAWGWHGLREHKEKRCRLFLELDSRNMGLIMAEAELVIKNSLTKHFGKGPAGEEPEVEIMGEPVVIKEYGQVIDFSKAKAKREAKYGPTKNL